MTATSSTVASAGPAPGGWLAPADRSAASRRFDPGSLIAPMLAAGLVTLGLLAGWRGVDLAAQVYRVGQFRQHGFTLWDTQWYGGHWTLNYSVAFPATAALVGLGGVAVASAALAALAFDRLAVGALGSSGRLASVVFAAGLVVQSAIGQLPFLEGEALALCACWAMARKRWMWAVIAASAAALASPLAAAFAALAALAWAATNPDRRRLGPIAVAAAALAPIGVTAVAFPGQGPMPYPAVDLAWELAIATSLWLLLPATMTTLRAGIVVWSAAAITSFAVASPLGGNIGRMEDCLALPLAVIALWPRRRLLLAVMAVPLVLTVWGPAWAAMTSDGGQPSTHQSFYRPLVAELRSEAGPPGRVEVVPTEFHWEAAWVAPQVPLARGWERQDDMADNPLFYGRSPLDAASYRAWLTDNGVRFVALAHAPLDFAGTAEARLIDNGVNGLALVWHNADWRLYSVAGSEGIVDGPAQLIMASGDRMVIRARASGSVLLRVHWNPDLRVVEGAACLGPAPGGWTLVRVPGPEQVGLRVALSGSSGGRCPAG
jgi:hypothetical protein